MDNIIAENYNKEFNKMKNELKQTHKNDKTEFTSKMRNFFILRVICVVLAFYGYFYLCILVSAFQFLLLPYSLIISLSKMIEIFYNLFLGYYIYFPVTYYFLTTKLISDNSIFLNLIKFNLEINNELIFCFFIIDFLIEFIFTFYTPIGKTAQLPLRRILKSIIYGFLNSKSYFLILFVNLCAYVLCKALCFVFFSFLCDGLICFGKHNSNN